MIFGIPPRRRFRRNGHQCRPSPRRNVQNCPCMGWRTLSSAGTLGTYARRGSLLTPHGSAHRMPTSGPVGLWQGSGDASRSPVSRAQKCLPRLLATTAAPSLSTCSLGAPSQRQRHTDHSRGTATKSLWRSPGVTVMKMPLPYTMVDQNQTWPILVRISCHPGMSRVRKRESARRRSC